MGSVGSRRAKRYTTYIGAGAGMATAKHMSPATKVAIAPLQISKNLRRLPSSAGRKSLMVSSGTTSPSLEPSLLLPVLLGCLRRHMCTTRGRVYKSWLTRVFFRNAFMAGNKSDRNARLWSLKAQSDLAFLQALRFGGRSKLLFTLNIAKLGRARSGCMRISLGSLIRGPLTMTSSVHVCTLRAIIVCALRKP